MDIQKENFNAHIMAVYGEHVIWNGDKPTDIRYADLWITWQQAQKVAVPDGYVVVPREPTNKMSLSGYHVLDRFVSMAEVDTIYKAMIEAQEQNNA